MARKPAAYTNESITSLKGADRVRKRPGVIFGSDGVDGCAHSIFEILSNAIDEAREGYGNRILITKFKDGSVEVEDFGRGMPVDYNKNEQRYNWELLFCEMYAGGKYSAGADNYEYSLGRFPLSPGFPQRGKHGRAEKRACHPQKNGLRHPLEAGCRSVHRYQRAQ